MRGSAIYCLVAAAAAVTNPPLRSKGWNPVAVLGHCKGDCDSDADCKNGLECVQRSGWKDVVQ